MQGIGREPARSWDVNYWALCSQNLLSLDFPLRWDSASAEIIFQGLSGVISYGPFSFRRY